MLNIVRLLLVAGYWTVELLVAGRLIALRLICESFRNCVKTSTVSSSFNCLFLLLLVLLCSCCLIAKLTIAGCWNELLLAVELQVE
jgi:hypothetical protein